MHQIIENQIRQVLNGGTFFFLSALTELSRSGGGVVVVAVEATAASNTMLEKTFIHSQMI